MTQTLIHIDASKSYDIQIGPGALERDELPGDVVRGVRRALVVSDDNVYPLYGEKVRAYLTRSRIESDHFVFPAGEQSKNLATYGEILEYMCGIQMTRSDMLVALGGGVAGDMTGFAAATYQRGIKFIQIPTTLLSAVDASVGGKTAIDLKSGKNLCGCFYQPSFVLCDTDTFHTLPQREYRAGCAEIIKYAMLESKAFLEDIIKRPVSDHYEEVVGKCVLIKSRYVEADEFDTGMRMLLNLGHTIGHAVEAASDFSILHGEAVAMGMYAITKAAVRRGICSEETLLLLKQALDACGLESVISYTADELLRSALLDKKAAGANLRLVLPLYAGKCVTETISKDELAGWMTDGGIR